LLRALQGLQVMGSGEKTVRFRPNLIFTNKHAREASSVFARAFASLKL
jgi:4-aminobutyrate aminotransferase-like enzyme